MKSLNKLIIILAACLFLAGPVYAQKGKLPPFKIEMGNGKTFKASQLPYEKAILIAYFSPDCEDCQAFISSLLKKINHFSHTSIVLVTQESKEEMNKFIKKYKLNKYANIYVGTEEKTLFLGQYYNLEKLPYLALYNKNGDLQATYAKHFSLDGFIKKYSNIL